jgi:hypothetical protein
MPTPTEIRERIAAIDATLETGVASNTVDGETTSFDHDTLRRERAKLEQKLGVKRRRHRVFNFNMGGR